MTIIPPKLAAAKDWLIRLIFVTTNDPSFYRSWHVDQWYIAKTKHIFDYVSWSNVGRADRIYIVWIACGLFDMANVLAAVNVFWAYVWPAVGMSYILAGLFAVSIVCMSAKYNPIVDWRLRNKLMEESADWKTLHNGHVCSCTHDSLTRDCFAMVLHRQLKDCVQRGKLFWMEEELDLFFDFADVADSIAPAMNGDLE